MPFLVAAWPRYSITLQHLRCACGQNHLLIINYSLLICGLSRYVFSRKYPRYIQVPGIFFVPRADSVINFLFPVFSWPPLPKI